MTCANGTDSCSDQGSVYEGTVTILSQQGSVVTTTQSDSHGQFSVAVAPGTYTVEAGGSMCASRQCILNSFHPYGSVSDVVVTTGQTTTISLTLAS